MISLVNFDSSVYHSAQDKNIRGKTDQDWSCWTQSSTNLQAWVSLLWIMFHCPCGNHYYLLGHSDGPKKGYRV